MANVVCHDYGKYECDMFHNGCTLGHRCECCGDYVKALIKCGNVCMRRDKLKESKDDGTAN
jgi:hypothetical protein